MHSLETIKKINGEYPADPAEPIAQPVFLTERNRALGINKDKPVPMPYDVGGAIIAFASGEMDEDADDVIELFQHLVDTGLAWELQGSYGRMAKDLINQGFVTPPRHAVTRREREFNEARKEPLRKGHCAP